MTTDDTTGKKKRRGGFQAVCIEPPLLVCPAKKRVDAKTLNTKYIHITPLIDLTSQEEA